MHTARGDGVAGIKQHRRDLSSDGVKNLVTASRRGRLKRGSRIIYVATASGLQSRLRKLSAEEAWATIKNLAQYEDKGWDDPVDPEEGSLNHENPDIEQLLGVIEYKVDALMKDAISLIGKERVRQLEEYMKVIVGDFMKLSSEVTRRLKEKIREEGSRMRTIKKITKYPDMEAPKPLAGHKFPENPKKNVLDTLKSTRTNSLWIRYVQLNFSNPPRFQKSTFGFKPVMSSASSAVTYTSVYTDSEPGRVFWGADEEISDGDVPRVIVYGYDGLPMQPVDPPSPDYVPGPEHPASPDYVPGPEHPPSPIEIPYVPEPEYPEYLVPSEDEAPMEDQPLPADASPVALSPGYVPDSDPEEDPEEDSEEEHADYPADGGDGDDEPSGDDTDDDDADDDDEEPFEDEEDDEEEEEHLAPADSPVIPVVDPVPSAGDTEAFETDESAPTPRPPQIRIPFAQTRLRRARKTVRPEPPMSASMEARIAEHAAAPTPPLPVTPLPLPLPSPLTTSPTDAGAPLGYRAAGIRMRAAVASPPSLLPPTSPRTDIPEAEMPPRKRACLTTPAPGYEIGESSAAGAARQPRPTPEVDTWDEIVEAMMEIAPTTLEGVDQRVTELDTTVRQRTEEFKIRFEEARDDRAYLGALVNSLYRDRPYHRHTALAMNLPQNRKQAEIHSNVLKPGMYRIATTTTQNREPQLPHASRNTNPHVSKSLGVNHTTSVSRPQLKCYQVKDKVVPNNSQVKFKKKEVEDHHRISSISKKTKSVTACNDSSKSRTLNVNAVCAECGKCVFNSNHDACVSRYLNDVNARTKKPKVVPISASKPKRKANKSVATPHKKTIVQLILFIVDSGCTKHMTGNLKLLCNFVEKFMGTVHFGNDQFAPILGYGDLNQGNVTIKRVYYVEGLNHNLFSVGQFCDADLEVAFRKSTCFVRDLQGNDLLTGLVPQGQKVSDYDNSDTVPPRQHVVPTAEKTDSSQQGLEFLFSPLLEEYYNPTHGHAEDNNNG
ncbi:hypothetical protein Tco_0820896 [Tanacetum coccineum]|uniref:Retrovirus-related Pol polyprotein from transposon TNT 1-94-like beta-barrel domain-containing protein n=1 Tax=Tanacetum coccineum TaxID=301880 RepID=A0ABQ5ADV9_9ASTR